MSARNRRFKIVGYADGGVQKDSSGRLMLVCYADSGESIGFSGRPGLRYNIDTVLAAGLPCTVECRAVRPSASMRRWYGHTFFVREGEPARVWRCELHDT